MKINWILGLFFLVVIILIIIHFNNKKDIPSDIISKSISPDGEEKILTYRLPTSMDTDVFGPKFWAAYHNLSEELPCSICRNEWTSFMIFAHDYKNYSLKKKIYNQDNFDKWLTKLCDIKKDMTN